MRFSELTEQQTLDEFQLNPTGVLASIIRWSVENPAVLAALGIAAGGGALALTSGTAALGPLMAAVTSINAGQGALGLYSLDKLKELIQQNPSQAEGYIKKLIYKYVGDQSDVQEFEKLHAQTAYKSETKFRWRAEEWPVTMDKKAAESYLEKHDKYWLDTYNQEQAQQSARPTEGVAEGSGRDSWDSNMPGYQGDYGGAENWGRREREDDEHHEIDRRMEQERERQNTQGTWYVRVDGRVIPKSYTGKSAANAAALEFKKQPGNENKLVMLTMREQ